MPYRPRMIVAAFAAVLSLSSSADAARPRPLALRRVDVDLPGPPSAVVPADLDGDGRVDLLVVTAYTRWGSIAQDRVEDAVAVTEVVPALFDAREVRAFLAGSDGTFRAAPPVPLSAAVIALAPGTPAHPVLALTGEGLSALTWTASETGGGLSLVPLLVEPSALAQAGSFLAELRFLDDVDGDGNLDAVIPARDGIAIHRGTTGGGFEETASYRSTLAGDRLFTSPEGSRRQVPIPEFLDVDGDGRKDLVVSGLDGSPQALTITRGLGEGRFGPSKTVKLGCVAAEPPRPANGAPDGGGPRIPRRVAWFGDLDADGRAEIVTRETVDTGKSDRKQATSPSMVYRFHRLRPDLTVDAQPYATLEAVGYAFTGQFQDGIDLEFLDLDGDGRKDLVTVTLDVSMFQVLRALTSKKIGIGLEFRVFAQGRDGVFRLVPGQVLAEKLNFDLNRLEISRLGQFRGDFDGDGRTDFVHLGRGKSVTVHRGQEGCRYPEKPDLAIELDEEPEDALLVRVRDFDGDRRSDVAITRTRPAPEPGASAPVTLELHLSGEPR